MGRALPIYRVRAQNVAAESANKIHDDQVAATYGFRGGLVPGVTVYGYMTAPIVEMAPEWLERGSMSLRLIEPFYDGEEVIVRVEAGDDGSFAVTAETSGRDHLRAGHSLDSGRFVAPSAAIAGAFAARDGSARRAFAR